ncbi:unnamed protein product [Darwinula stevensoni]|uniref:JmjC domain-containing protein n=1 Tax=Darwinula stevensoni TaxID=69355 RepID=A0A7R9A6M1_9CRUS|nr:unnamed protein product [Darwinula stevensoni]CAG0895024.1 unnamed protein product [Darwinula stevensoni]
MLEGMREMCDACRTTIFNFHWVCEACGFMACSDCVADRRGTEGEGEDWAPCKGQGGQGGHRPDGLRPVQLVPFGEIFTEVSRRFHELRERLQPGLRCPCKRKGKGVNEVNELCNIEKQPASLGEDDSAKTISNMFSRVPHTWLCGEKLLCLEDPKHADNQSIFEIQWSKGHPVTVADVHTLLNMDLWTPASISKEFGDREDRIVNCRNGEVVIGKPLSAFWAGFQDLNEQLEDETGEKMPLKLVDWPPDKDLKELSPSRFRDLVRSLPLSEYTRREGVLNLISRLPDAFVEPDLGPKMYIAYGSGGGAVGTTKLHLDMADAINVMVHVGMPRGADRRQLERGALKAAREGGCDRATLERLRRKGVVPGALWHVYHADDVRKIRDFLARISKEKGEETGRNRDPIHDGLTYLDAPLRRRLREEYGVKGYAIAQCLGDAILIPAGAPHQVQNLLNCMKVAEDFVSPQNVRHCLRLTQEFRRLSDQNSYHEDKLQMKNVLYHAMKDAIACLSDG